MRNRYYYALPQFFYTFDDKLVTMKSLLTMAHVHKTFLRNAVDSIVLQDVSIEFMSGVSYGIRGASGSGKSTLLHLLAGLELPTRGEIILLNQSLSRSYCHSYILQQFLGIVFQSPYLIQELTVIENIMAKGMIAGNNIKSIRKRAQEVLEYVELSDKAEYTPSMLSGGQQQRVSLARALFNRPIFLLADEPTGNLDDVTGKSIIDLLVRCKKEWEVGLIISSHDSNLAHAMDQILYLEQGKLQQL